MKDQAQCHQNEHPLSNPSADSLGTGCHQDVSANARKCALAHNHSGLCHSTLKLLVPTDVQERTQALEAELAQASAQLQQLQAVQASLSTKNQLLEKLLNLHKQANFKSSPELPQSSAVSFSTHSILHAHFDTNPVAYLSKRCVQVTTRAPLCQTELLEGGCLRVCNCTTPKSAI